MSLPNHLRKDIEYLIETDKFFGKVNLSMPDFSWRKTRNAFSSLVRIVLAQQVSTAVANTLWNRLNEVIGEEMEPQKLARLTDDDLRGIGLSRQKIGYLRELVLAMEEGSLDPDKLENLSDEDVASKIMAIKGFGLWSAQMYLIFTLARPDIWPAQDLIIRHGVGKYLKKKERPEVDQTRKFGDKFKGRRTALALLFWSLNE